MRVCLLTLVKIPVGVAVLVAGPARLGAAVTDQLVALQGLVAVAVEPHRLALGAVKAGTAGVAKSPSSRGSDAINCTDLEGLNA
jgi:hypothetical protein